MSSEKTFLFPAQEACIPGKVWYNVSMKANEKHPALDALITSLTAVNRVEFISRGWCMTCDFEGIPAHDTFFEGGYWKDALSLAEYKISGMCQGCQDETFGK
jgi:hypothetical protein